MLKQLFLILLLTSSILLMAEDNLSLSLKYQYNNILNWESSDMYSEINGNITRLNFTWIHNYFSTGFNIYRDSRNANCSGLDTDIIYPLEVVNDELTLDEMALYPEFFVTYNNSSIYISIPDEPEVTYTLEIPILPFLSMGVDKEILYSSTDQIDILGSYTIYQDIELLKRSAYLDVNVAWFEAGIAYNYFSLTYDYDSTLEGNIGTNLDIESEWAGSAYTGYRSDLLDIRATVEYATFNLSDNSIYILHEGSLVGGSTEPGDLDILSFRLDSKLNKSSITLAYNRYSIDEFTSYFTTDSFIYSSLAFEKYIFTIPEILIQNFSIGFNQEISLPICTLDLGVTYDRYSIDPDTLEYTYGDYIWGLWSNTRLSYGSDSYTSEYDHINIVDLELTATFPLNESISIVASGSQLLPFFDEDISNIISDTSNSSASSSSNNESISGGTTLSLEFNMLL